MASGQRAPFAGSRPNGYKDKLQTDKNQQNNVNINNNGLADRFGGDAATGTTGTTERLPNLALGDRDIVDRLSAVPVDQRPFWLINTQAIEAQKNQGQPTTSTNNQGTIDNRFGSGSSTGTVGSRPSYPSVVYPLEMTPQQQQQAQQQFQNQIQQNILLSNRINTVNTNQLSTQTSVPVQATVVPQQTIVVNGPNSNPQPVQGRLTSSGYRG